MIIKLSIAARNVCEKTFHVYSPNTSPWLSSHDPRAGKKPACELVVTL